MTQDVDIASRTLLIAYDPASGRRPDIQRLGPVVRAVALADLLGTEAIIDLGSSVRSQGVEPPGLPMRTIWRDCREEVSWRAAVRKNSRSVIHECEQVLAEMKLVTLSNNRFGPFRSRSAQPTPQGQQCATQWRQDISDELADRAPSLPVATLAFALGMTHLGKVIGVERRAPSLAAHLPPGLASAIRRASQTAIVMG